MLRNWNIEILIDKKSNKAVYLQIADAIIRDIHSGRLRTGDALPGSRNLAQLLDVNRNTVVEALNVLLIEGWLISKERQGTFVSDKLPDFREPSENKTKTSFIKEPSNERIYLQFDDGHPNSKIAPITELARAYRKIFNQKAKWKMMGYSNEYGEIEFRKAIVQMLNHQRGMHIDEHDICITRGSQMAMYLTAQCLINKNDYILIENPGYKPAWKAFEKAGAKLLTVNVDKDGLVIDEVISYLESGKKIKAIYVTPHRQYPTTVTLSLKRRLELIELSNKYDFTIIEDDYDNEFHFGYRPVLPISCFNELNNFVYIGTMSKVVAPALRIGYLATNNSSLIKEIGSLRKIIDVQGDSIMEQAVLQIMKDGTVKRHIKKATNYYKTKRDFTANLLEKYFKDKASYSVPEGGLAFWIVPFRNVNRRNLSNQLNKMGIRILTLENYSLDEDIIGLRLGYGSLSEKELEDGLIALASVL